MKLQFNVVTISVGCPIDYNSAVARVMMSVPGDLVLSSDLARGPLIACRPSSGQARYHCIHHQPSQPMSDFYDVREVRSGNIEMLSSMPRRRVLLWPRLREGGEGEMALTMSERNGHTTVVTLQYTLCRYMGNSASMLLYRLLSSHGHYSHLRWIVMDAK
jgi:hypothetical protein